MGSGHSHMQDYVLYIAAIFSVVAPFGCLNYLGLAVKSLVARKAHAESR